VYDRLLLASSFSQLRIMQDNEDIKTEIEMFDLCVFPLPEKIGQV
jgi:hypothetical protein